MIYNALTTQTHPTIRAEQHEQLRIVSLALWRVINTKFDVQDDELRAAMDRVANELQDVPQGGSLVDCPVCRHAMQSTAMICLYCGTRQR